MLLGRHFLVLATLGTLLAAALLGLRLALQTATLLRGSGGRRLGNASGEVLNGTFHAAKRRIQGAHNLLALEAHVRELHDLLLGGKSLQLARRRRTGGLSLGLDGGRSLSCGGSGRR